MLDFSKLDTPAEGAVLIEPPPQAWPKLLAENVRARGEYRFTLAGEPAEVAIAETRAILADGPIIACGHQPAFIHPGVWVKHVAVEHAAVSFAAAGLDFVVDNDAPPSSGLTVPTVGPDGMLSRREVAFAGAPAGTAYEGRPPLSLADITRIRSELSDLLGDRFEQSLMPDYLNGAAETANARDSVIQHLQGRSIVDTSLGAALPEARVSDAFGGLFLADLLLNPEPFAVAYNHALAQYRQEHNVRSPDRPLPDLGRDADRTEAALWIYRPMHRRQRLWVRRAGDQVELLADAEPVGKLAARDLARTPDAAMASLTPWVVRPRALTLTLWARLLACDFFVHGIGGAKYDRITDEIMRRYYRCPPPAYACVSATLRLDLPQFESSPASLRAAHQEHRDWHYNPQRHLENPPAELVEERARLIQRSAELRAAGAPRVQRREVFHAIRDVNARLVSVDPQREARLLAGIARQEREIGSNTLAGSREYFYCLYPRGPLDDLAERLRAGW